jgi:hypothetical protein
MARTRVHRRPPLIVPALVLLAILVAIYLPVRSRIAESDRARVGPPPGTSISVFFTSQLVGYREPCG